MASYKKIEIKTLSQAIAILGSRESVKIGNNTILKRIQVDDKFGAAVQHFQTDIVQYLPNGNVRLDDGGHASATTKKRLCQYTNVSIAQKNGKWYCHTADGVYEFVRGIEFTENGTCTDLNKKVSNV